jgi:hypothetical protein
MIIQCIIAMFMLIERWGIKMTDDKKFLPARIARCWICTIPICVGDAYSTYTNIECELCQKEKVSRAKTYTENNGELFDKRRKEFFDGIYRELENDNTN